MALFLKTGSNVISTSEDEEDAGHTNAQCKRGDGFTLGLGTL